MVLKNRTHWLMVVVGIAIVLVVTRPNGWPFRGRAESNTPPLTIQCSSVLDDKPVHACTNALPGVSGDWISAGDKEGAWVEYSAADKQSFVVTSVLLIDRSDAGADILDGHFEFEGGTITRYPNEGGIGALSSQTESFIAFPEPITTTRIRFVVDKVSPTTEDAGLAEFRPYYVLGSVAKGIPSSYTITCIDQFDEIHRCANVAPYAGGDWWSREEPEVKDLSGAWIEIASLNDRDPVQLIGVEIAGTGDQERAILKGHLEIANDASGNVTRLPRAGSIALLNSRTPQALFLRTAVQASSVRFVVDEAAPQARFAGLSLFQFVFVTSGALGGELLDGTIGVASPDPDGSQPLIPLADYTLSKTLPCVLHENQENHLNDVLSVNITSEPVTLNPTPPVIGKPVTLSVKIQNDLRKTKSGLPTPFGLSVDWGDGIEGIAGPVPDQPLSQGSSVRVDATHTYTKLPQGLTIQLGTVDAKGVVNSPAYRCPVELEVRNEKSLAIPEGSTESVGLELQEEALVEFLQLNQDVGGNASLAVFSLKKDGKTYTEVSREEYQLWRSARGITIAFSTFLQTQMVKVLFSAASSGTEIVVPDISTFLTARDAIKAERIVKKSGQYLAITVRTNTLDFFEIVDIQIRQGVTPLYPFNAGSLEIDAIDEKDVKRASRYFEASSRVIAKTFREDGVNVESQERVDPWEMTVFLPYASDIKTIRIIDRSDQSVLAQSELPSP